MQHFNPDCPYCLTYSNAGRFRQPSSIRIQSHQHWIDSTTISKLTLQGRNTLIENAHPTRKDRWYCQFHTHIDYGFQNSCTLTNTMYCVECT